MKNRALSLKSFVQETLKNPLFSGSLVMVIGSNLANAFAFLYHVVFGRILSLESYGELAATISLIGFIASALVFFSVVIVKFISSAKEKEQKQFFNWFMEKAAILGIVMIVLSLVLTPFLSSFLHIESKVILLIGPIFFISLISLVFKSFMQGTLRFGQSVIINNVEMAGRLLIGAVFVYIGWSVFGAVLGYFLSIVLAVIVSRFFLKEYKFERLKKNVVDTKKIISYSVPILLSAFTTNSILLSDVLLTKHFFTARDAGIYASVATIGKIVFYATAPVTAVMFPMVSKKHANGEKYMRVFALSLLLTFGMASCVLLMFLIVPNLAVKTLYGERYSAAAGNIFWYGVFMTLFTLSSLILNFYLSIGKTKLVSIAVIASLMQVVGIWFYHPSLSAIITVSIISCLFFLVSLLLYFVYETRKIF